MASPHWHDLGPTKDLMNPPLREVIVDRTKLAVSFKDGKFGVISGICNHVGGPLGGGTLDGEYVVCPWHYWKFHRETGIGEPGFEEDRVPKYDVKVENGHLFVNLAAS